MQHHLTRLSTTPSSCASSILSHPLSFSFQIIRVYFYLPEASATSYCSFFDHLHKTSCLLSFSFPFPWLRSILFKTLSVTIQSSVIRFLLTISFTTVLPVHSLSNMQTTFALAAALAGVAYAASPAGSAPAGFVTTYPSPFQITAVNSTVVVAKRDIQKVCDRAISPLRLY